MKRVYFLKLHMGVSLRTKFQVSSIILASFRQEVISSPYPTSRTQIGLKTNKNLKAHLVRSELPVSDEVGRSKP